MSELKVMPIDPARLGTMRRTGADEHGNEWAPFSARGWEPLRCCLSLALEGVPIVLISYQPLAGPSPWAEVGPVFVHAHACDGYRTPDALPTALAVGPRVLRTYHADGALDYDHIRVVGDGEPVEPVLRDLFDTTDVAFVHARSVSAQCFTYAVHRG